MGAPMTRAGVLLFGKPSAATPLLGHVAGLHAERIARFWPAPHAGFLTLPAILLERRWNSSADDGVDIVHAVERARDADLARILMQGEAPGGLMKALGRMGEILWEAQAYADLLKLFTDADAVKVLRHMPQIKAGRLGLIAAVPSALRVPGILVNLPDRVEAVEDLSEAYRLALRIHGASEAGRIVQRWGRATSSLWSSATACGTLRPISPWAGWRSTPCGSPPARLSPWPCARMQRAGGWPKRC